MLTKPMRILTVVGARPQFIKAAAVSRAICETEGLSEVMIHTGQHFDDELSGVFFAQLGLPTPEQMIDEKCLHTGGIYADKRLALWRLADVSC